MDRPDDVTTTERAAESAIASDGEAMRGADSGLLQKTSESVKEADTVDEALVSFCSALASMVTCDMVAVLDAGTDDHVLHMKFARPVSPATEARVEREMMERFDALCPLKVRRENLRTRSDRPAGTDGGVVEPHVAFAVPVVLENEVRGLLGASPASPDGFSARDQSFLQHAAAHLSTVVRTLERLRESSQRDPMTGIYNRKGLQKEFLAVWAQSRRTAQPLAVAIMDLDNFKMLNDTHGHLAGDDVLREFVGLVRHVARASDVIGRFGGDEVVVVLPHAGSAEGLSFAERLMHAVRTHIFCAGSSGGYKLTVSVGVASTVAGAEATMADVLARADQALIEAKRLGRNRACIRQSAPANPAAPAAAAPAASAERVERGPRGSVLVVDDEVIVANMLTLALRRAGFEVQSEHSAAAALRAVQERVPSFDVVLTDLNLPGKSGFELLDELRSVDDSIMKIVITGLSTVENAIHAMRRGVSDFLEKPVRIPQLIAVVERAVEFRNLRSQNERYRNSLEDMVRQKSAALQQALDQLRAAHNFTLEAMASMLDARERGVAMHSARVRDLALVLARAIGMAESAVEDVGRGALLHDIGKICVPDAILLKPAPLDEHEREVMRSHPEVGYRLLRTNPYLEPAAQIVYQHQEHFDGSGYPQGLRGEQICEGARLFAVLDAYDAMRSWRPYSAAKSREVAAAEIRKGAGTQFDPHVAEVFLANLDEIERVGGWATLLPPQV